MIGLYTFVAMLEKDWNVSTEFQSTTETTRQKTSVLHWVLKRSKKWSQEATGNDGRPPDTTKKNFNSKNKKHSKVGHSQHASQFNKIVWPAYPSYQEVTDNTNKRNCCWLSAGLVSLYALFSPLWIFGISGCGKDLFTATAHHFSSWSTAKLNCSNSICSTLTWGEKNIFEAAYSQYPGSFITGVLLSCDFFIEVSSGSYSPQKKKKI